MSHNHTCSHETCAIRRTGDALIITCAACGQSTTYPLDGGEPFEPKRVRIPSWVVITLILSAALAFAFGLAAIILLTLFSGR
jgi:hypothetical protein